MRDTGAHDERNPFPARARPNMPDLPDKIREQMAKAELPQTGAMPFKPKLVRNRRGEPTIKKATAPNRPKSKKNEESKGYVDEQDRVWVRDPAHAGLPEHWDVQIEGGTTYIRVGLDGNIIP